MEKKYKFGYLMVAIEDRDEINVEWISKIRNQCEKLVVGIPSNDVYIDLYGRVDKKKNNDNLKYWKRRNIADDIILLDSNMLSYQEAYNELKFDVCFMGSFYGKKYDEDVAFLKGEGVEIIQLTPDVINSKVVLGNPLSRTYLEKEIVLFGSGKYFESYMSAFGKEFPPKYAVDNNNSVWNTNKCGVDIFSTDELKKENPEKILVVICIKNTTEIIEQLKSIGNFDYRTLQCFAPVAHMEEAQFGATLDEQGRVLRRVQQINYDMLLDFDTKLRAHNVPYFLGFGSLLGAVRHKAIIPWDNDVDTLVKRTDLDKIKEFSDEFSGQYFWMPNTILGNKKYFDCMDRICYRDAYINNIPEMDSFYENYYNSIHLDMFLIDKTYDNFRGKFQRFELAVLYGLMNAYRHEAMFADYDKKMQFRNAIMCFCGKFVSLNWLKKRADKVARRFDDDDKAPYYFISNDVLAKLQMLFPAEIFDHSIDVPFGQMQAQICLDYDVVLRHLFKDYMKLPAKKNRVPHIGRMKMTSDSYVFEKPLRGKELLN